MHYRRVSISGERAGARSVAGRQYVFGSPRCNDDLRQLPSGHSDNASQRSKVSELCRHCQPTDNHGAFFETVPAFQPILSRADTDDVVAYILSIKPK